MTNKAWGVNHTLVNVTITSHLDNTLVRHVKIDMECPSHIGNVHKSITPFRIARKA